MTNKITQVEVKTVSGPHRSPLFCPLAILLCCAAIGPNGNAQQGDNAPSSIAAFADFNSDGKIDVVVTGPPGAVMWLGNGDGTFGNGVGLTSPNGTTCVSV